MRKPRVAFLCVHNACRSQIAEALGRYYARDVFESWSAGTVVKARIDPDAVRVMKQLYGIDMEETQKPKLLSALPQVDVAVTMGCNVECPDVPCRFREDWGMEDPTGRGEEELVRTIRRIEQKILELRDRLSQGEQGRLPQSGD